MARGSARGAAASPVESSDLAVVLEGDADLGPGSTPTASEGRTARRGAPRRVRRLELVGVAAMAAMVLVSSVLVLAGDLAPSPGAADRPPLRAPAYQRAPSNQQPPVHEHSPGDQQLPDGARAGGSGPAEPLGFGEGSTPPVESMGAWRALRMVVRAEDPTAKGRERRPEGGTGAAAARGEGGTVSAGALTGTVAPGPPGAPAQRRVVPPDPFVADPSQLVAVVPAPPGLQAVPPSPREGFTEPQG